MTIAEIFSKENLISPQALIIGENFFACQQISCPVLILLATCIYIRFFYMLTYLIPLSVVGSIDESGVSKKVRVSWPCCFVKAIGQVETQAKTEFSGSQAITVEIIGICCKLNE